LHRAKTSSGRSKTTEATVVTASSDEKASRERESEVSSSDNNNVPITILNIDYSEDNIEVTTQNALEAEDAENYYDDFFAATQVK
jgi:hypothetical protein